MAEGLHSRRYLLGRCSAPHDAGELSAASDRSETSRLHRYHRERPPAECKSAFYSAQDTGQELLGIQ